MHDDTPSEGPRSSGTITNVIRIAFPLVLASSGHAVRLFADRVMLARYSPEAIAASMPSGLTCFVIMSVFIGTASYANAFVAQYTGAGRPERAGLAVWQGIYVALLGGAITALAAYAARPIFDWMGHAPAVREEQVRYFQVLCRFATAPILLATLNTFWSGRGRTRVVMAIELLCAGVNILLNYMLIFGRLGAPRMGIVGAGIATGLSAVVGVAVALALFLVPNNRQRFGTWPRRTLDPPLLARLLRFGLPNGIQFTLDLAAFNLFVVFIGKLGTVELEAANIAFSLNALAFLPIMGIGMTAAILVGQGIGAGNIAEARRGVRNAAVVAILYNVVLGVLFLSLAHPILSVFTRAGDPNQPLVLATAARCLRYITAYLLFDAVFIVYSHAIKGAGDTRFAMLMGLSLSWGTLVLPAWLATRVGISLWGLWRVLVLHVVLAAAVFYARYRSGKWQHMRVVEATAQEPPPPPPVPLETDIHAERTG